MKTIDENTKVSVAELKDMALKMHGNLVKAVVDVEKEIMVIDAELHADQEAKLIQLGSIQENLWGINFYPEKKGVDFLEFDSMINLRPSANNLSRGVEDKKIQGKIIRIVSFLTNSESKSK